MTGTPTRSDLIGQLSAGWVAEMFFGTHAMTEMGLFPLGWPDGRPFLDQPAKWNAIVKLCRSEVLKWVKEQRKHGR